MIDWAKYAAIFSGSLLILQPGLWILGNFLSSRRATRKRRAVCSEIQRIADEGMSCLALAREEIRKYDSTTTMDEVIQAQLDSARRCRFRLLALAPKVDLSPRAYAALMELADQFDASSPNWKTRPGAFSKRIHGFELRARATRDAFMARAYR